MAELTGWEAVAREIGDHHIAGWGLTVLKSGPEHAVGDWLPAEAAAKEILRLRSQVVEGYARCRGIAQGIIDCIGSIGPEDAEGAAARACAEIQRLRERLAELTSSLHEIAQKLQNGMDANPASSCDIFATLLYMHGLWVGRELAAADQQQETDR